MDTNITENITRHYVPSDGNMYHKWHILAKKSNPESDQASRSNCQFIGTTWIKECETILLLGYDEQNPECGKLEKTNDPLSPTSSKALKMMGEKAVD